MSRPGGLSIKDHRAWVAKYGEWRPPTLRPGEKLVDHVMGQLATALERSEAELLEDVVARVDFDEAERVRVVRWAREAVTILVLTAERAGSSGTRLSDNVLFHELALRWSPTYVKARERGPGLFPSEMKPETLQAARDDLKAAGFRLQPLFGIVTQAVAGWYETHTTAKGRRVVLRGRPLKGEALKEARALLGLPPLERVRGHLLRDDDPPHSIHRRIETTDPAILEAERILGKDLLLAFPPSLESYTLVADARVTAETEFEPIRSGPRSRAVVRILDETRLAMNVRAARVELARLWRKLKAARAQVAVVIRPHKKVNATMRIVTHQVAGSVTKNIRTTVEYKGQILSEKKTTRTMKRIHTDDARQQKARKKNVWFPPWSTDEIAALEAKRSVEQQYRALKPVVRSLVRKTGEVIIKTQHRQAINRRWHPTSFWMEDLPGDSSTEREYIPETYDSATGEVDEGAFDLVTKARGRLFRVIRKSKHGRGRTFGGDKLEGVDVSSSQYQILAVLLNDEALEKALAEKSAHQIAADHVYPGDPDGASRAKLVLVAGGYGSSPDRISWRKKIPLVEVQQVLSSLGPNIGKYIEYTREVAYAVDTRRGFRFTDRFDGSVVVWHPILAEEHKVGSDRVQLMTYVLANGGAVNRKKLAQQIAPMLIHTLDSAFSGFVVEGLHRRGVKDIIALFDCWLVPSHYLSEYRGNPRLFEEVIIEAGEKWLPMLGPIYDALLEYKSAVSEPAWMESLKEAWHRRLEERRWPLFRTKRITTYEYE